MEDEDRGRRIGQWRIHWGRHWGGQGRKGGWGGGGDQLRPRVRRGRT